MSNAFKSLENVKFLDTTLIGILLAVITAVQAGLGEMGFEVFKTPAFYVSLSIAVLGIISRGLKPASEVEKAR